ncbi:Transcription initiation factor IIF, alpha subunit [Corchorus capsularis]|uniref:Transcription initiation factor IIF subunit alpha n=1 Tax=Corchorus capsularis TaxID=210143 RepID=A0A1R3I2Z8_COCAP|nr:Transcription initiation factor IIF, alpha subunit [Corchorus capsularis]
MNFNPVLVPKKELKEEPIDNSPAKPAPSASARGTPTTSKSAKGKRKANDDDNEASNGSPLKKAKSETVCYQSSKTWLFTVMDIKEICFEFQFDFYFLMFQETESSVKVESALASKGIVATKGTSSAKAGSKSADGTSSSSKAGSTSIVGPVTEDEIRGLLAKGACNNI